MRMGKKKKKRIGFLKTLAIMLVAMLSTFSLSGCIGGHLGAGTLSGPSSSSGGSSEAPKFDNPYSGQSNDEISDYNSVFMGAIGVYDIDNDAQVFYDNYTGQLVSFNTLINRQFNALATVISASLQYAYGDGVFNGNISDFNASFTFNNVVKTTIYNETSTLKYPNSINGGYKLAQLTDESGNPQTDTDGQPIFEYSATDLTSNVWKSTNLSVGDIANALRYIYVNPVSLGSNLGNLSLTSNTGLQNYCLQNYYKSFNYSLNSNENISTIGFSEEYMWNVLYYVAYSLVGATNIQNSIDGKNVVFNGSEMNTVTSENYETFEKYKGYESVLPELISNAFKLVKNGRNISVGTNYCFDIANYNNFYDKTIFPILERNEYIFFDKLEDICDAEQSETSTGNGKDDWSNIGTDDIQKYDPDKVKGDDELGNETVKVGTPRKIKKIILIPKITHSSYSKENFYINNVSICLTTVSGTEEIEILTNLVDETGKAYNEQIKFDDGTFSITMEDGTIIDNDSNDPSKGDDSQSNKKDEMVTSNGHLKLQSVPSVNKYMNIASIFKDEDTSEKYRFSSVSKENIIKNAFKEIPYDVLTTGERMNIGRLNVCNQLFNMTKVATSTSKNGVASTISTNSNYTNYIEFEFKYYNSNGSLKSEIPALYLLEFAL